MKQLVQAHAQPTIPMTPLAAHALKYFCLLVFFVFFYTYVPISAINSVLTDVQKTNVVVILQGQCVYLAEGSFVRDVSVSLDALSTVFSLCSSMDVITA